ncbi:Modulator of FtsH protease HflK [Roseovarius litorisediminis]|uniref:Protein HflK n=1 Tax=Roseovarius litorisediminis TaxID=1312363 RepID=A0A1Y5RKP3_9RHOB|nr:FtsH protease activity modulator HflK [Roseovarius litorisediminis]SLN19454.1 Modulator of FtsH protease HflK [Roseovarius litorisediminis]
MAGNSGGPWGGGGNSGGGSDDDRDDDRGGRRSPEGAPQIPEIDELMRKGQDQLRVLMGGRGGGGNRGGSGGGGPAFGKGSIALGALAGLVLWGMASFYTVKPEEQSIELFLGKFSGIGTEGLNFAPWPVVTYEVFNVTTNRTEDIGVRRTGGDNDGLMLTTDENIVDIDFQVVWNVKNAQQFKFSLKYPNDSVRAISEAAMREVIAQSELAPILNRDRAAIEARVKELIQETLDNRETGINIIRVNFNKVDPPSQNVTVTDAEGRSSSESVIDAFRDVQAAEQERDRVERQADAYANKRLAEARGESAQLLEAAEGYRARVVNDAVGEASRFLAVLTEYKAAPEVTRKRLYLETMEKVLGDVDKIILENNVGGGGQGVVPYLPLNELRKNGGSN